jgi:hypothetical protein
MRLLSEPGRGFLPTLQCPDGFEGVWESEHQGMRRYHRNWPSPGLDRSSHILVAMVWNLGGRNRHSMEAPCAPKPEECSVSWGWQDLDVLVQSGAPAPDDGRDWKTPYYQD